MRIQMTLLAAVSFTSATLLCGVVQAQVGPDGGAGFWGIREVIGNGTINNVTDATNSLNSGNPTIFDGTAPYIDFQDPDQGNAGDFSPTQVYLSNGPGGQDDFIQSARGYIQVDTPGTYTFYARGDDGFRMQIVGQNWSSVTDTGDGTATISGDIFENNNNGGNVNGFGVINLPVGVYETNYLWWERAGGAYNELSAAFGTHTAFNAGLFDRVGDTASGGLALADAPSAVVPEPATAMLAILALAGLSLFGRRRRVRA